jgi:hypothetical protein
MGKAARIARRRKAAAAKAVVSGGRLKIVAITHPAVSREPGGGPDLSVDLRLVRSAVLYADEVVLLSPTAAVLAGVSAVGSAGSNGLLALVDSLDDRTLQHLGSRTGHEPDVDKLRAGLQLAAGLQAMSRTERRRLPPEVRRGLREHVDAPLRSATTEYQAAAATMNHSAGADELQVAIDRGVLTIDATPLIGTDDMDAITNAFVGEIKALLEDPSAHLLFDEQISSLAAAMVREGLVEPHRLALSHALRAGTGTGLVERLPALTGCSVGSVLDARVDLEGPLARYRRAVVHLASRIPTDAVLDSTLTIELDDLWRDEVVPSLVDLRQGLAEHSIGRALIRSTLASPKDIAAALATGALVFGVNDANAPVDVATTTGAAAGLAQIAASGIAHAHHAQTGYRRNDLYYLLEVDQRLAADTRPRSS